MTGVQDPYEWKDPKAIVRATDGTPYYRSMEDAAHRQQSFNNPSTYNPWSTQQVNPDGSTSSSFTGGFGQLGEALTMNAANAAATPLNFGQFGASDGSAAGQQASQAAFGQMKSRLDPMWQKSEHDMRRNAFQSGMGDGAAMDQSVGQFGRARNDAYSSAMGDALRQGMAAQQSAFGGNMAARQMDVDNQVRAKQQPWGELTRLQGFMGQPEYNTDNSMMVATSLANKQAGVRSLGQAEQIHRDKLRDMMTPEEYDRANVDMLAKDDLLGVYGSIQNKNNATNFFKNLVGQYQP